MKTLLTNLQNCSSARIIEISGGSGLQNQLRSIGILEGKVISIVTIHPFRGPVVVKVDETVVTLGRGFASRIVVETTE